MSILERLKIALAFEQEAAGLESRAEWLRGEERSVGLPHPLREGYETRPAEL